MIVCLSVCLSGILHCEGFLYCTDGDSDKENVDPNTIIISDDDDDESVMLAALGETGRPRDSDGGNADHIIISDDDDESAARGETGRPWWMSPSAGLFGDEPAASSMLAGPSSDADFFEDRVLHLRYLYQLSMEQRIRLIIKEIMQGMYTIIYSNIHLSSTVIDILCGLSICLSRERFI